MTLFYQFIAPGPIASTEGVKRLLPEAYKDAANALIPLKCMGHVSDCEQAALFLGSDASRWVTGTVLVVDGGN